MKILNILSFLLIVIVYLPAQVGVGPRETMELGSGEFTEKAMQSFKASHTIFVCRDDDDINTLEKAIKEVWTVTSISVVGYSDFQNMEIDVNTAVFTIGGLILYSNGKPTHCFMYIHLWMPKKKKRKKDNDYEEETYARIELQPSGKDELYVRRNPKKNLVEYFYKEGNIRNWQTGFLRGYLKWVNDCLLQEKERWLFDNILENQEITNLKAETLYIPDYVMFRLNKLSGDENKLLKQDKIFKDYPYKYQIIKTDELSRKILDSEKPFYYLIYVRSATYKFFTIFNSKTGEAIYSRYKILSLSIKDSDFEVLAEVIDDLSNKK